MAASEVSKRIIMITSREGHTHAHDFLFVSNDPTVTKKKGIVATLGGRACKMHQGRRGLLWLTV